MDIRQTFPSDDGLGFGSPPEVVEPVAQESTPQGYNGVDATDGRVYAELLESGTDAPLAVSLDNS